jgi:dephospho-CoA kinase
MRMHQKAGVIIALTGLKFAGKGTFASIAASEFGCSVYRTRDQILVDAPDYGILKPRAEISIAEMQRIGNEGRAKGGNGYWADRLFESARRQGVRRFIMDGVRHPDEIESLYGCAEDLDWAFATVAVEAPTLTRFLRVGGRNDEGDAQLRAVNEEDPVEELRRRFAKFLAMDDRDRGIGEPWHGQQVDACMAEARYDADRYRQEPTPSCIGFVLRNDGALDAFQTAARAALAECVVYAPVVSA